MLAGRDSRGGFSLIEVIAVLAISALLASATLPALLRQADYVAEVSENANLQSLAKAFQDGVSRQRYVPGQANWADFIATNAGWDVGTVLTNPANNPRAFLIDPLLNIGGIPAANLPYVQPASGSPTLPINPRFIILSSLSSALPFTNTISTNDFNALWTNPDNTVPTNSASWASWQGQGSDLRIARINLSSQFARVVLNNLDGVSGPVCNR